MSDGLEIINPLSRTGWDDLVIASGKGSFFHSSTWARVLNESYGYKPVYFAFYNDEGYNALVPFMEISSRITGKRGVSLPFTDYCEPIIQGDCTIGDVTARIVRFGKSAGWRYIELRSGVGMPVPASSFYYGHVLDIARDEKTLLSSFRESTRRNIKKAEKEGVKVSVSGSLDSIRKFYRLNCMTRKLHGLPPQPYRFFEKIYEHAVSEGYGMAVLADYNGKTIAGNVYFHFGDKAMYKYGASDREHLHLRANNLVMWEAIRHYAKNGFRSLCFGRTEPENSGLLQFKRGWGGQEQVVNYYKYDLKLDSYVTETSRLRGFHNKVFANMPVPFLRLAGYLLYKHMG
ncbi:MAG: peptidoglycan bridge formation glycyltransferase FemA/FemB family protein [Nitrospirota bacterium]